VKPLNRALLVALSTSVIAVGCSQPAPQAGVANAAPATATTQQSAPKPAPAPPAPAAKKAPEKPVVYVPFGENLLYNAGFETWDGETLKSWNLQEGFESEWKPVLGKKVESTDKPETFLVELPEASSEDKLVILAESVVPGRVIPGRRLFFSARVLASTPDKFHVLLTYKQAGKTETVRRIHSGNGQWEVLGAEFWVPFDADPNTFRVQFIRQKGDKGLAQVDDVVLRMMAPEGTVAPAKPAPAPAPAAAEAAKEAPKKEETKPVAAPEKSKKSEAPKAPEKKTEKATEKKK